MVLSQQAAGLDNLVECIVELAKLGDIAEDDTYENKAIAFYFILDGHSKWWVTIEDIRWHVEDCGSWTRIEFDKLSEDDIRRILVEFATFFIKLVEGISAVGVERDSDNIAASEDSPPVMPEQLAVLRTGALIKPFGSFSGPSGRPLDPERDRSCRGRSKIPCPSLQD